MSWNNSLETWGRYDWGVDGVTENTLDSTFPKYTTSFFSGGYLKVDYKFTASFETLPSSLGSFNMVWNPTFSGWRAITPSTGSFDIVINKISALFTGHTETSGALAILWPSISVRLTAANYVALSFSRKIWKGPFEYSSFNYTSIAQTDNDDIYLTSPSGLYKLTGTKDGTTNISASFTIPENDFNTNRVKRAEEILIGYNGGGLAVQTVHDGNESSVFETYGTDGKYKTKRAKVPKGLVHRYWGVKVSNINGSSFIIDELEVPYRVFNRSINK